MIKKIFLLLFAVIIIIQIPSCSDEPNTFGIGLLDSDFIVLDTLNTTIDSVAQTSSTFKTVVSLGASDNLLVGKKDNIEASFLIKFVLGLADSLKTDINSGATTITEAKVRLIDTYQWGDSSAAFNLTAHNVTSDWTSIGFTSDSLTSLTYDATNSASLLNLNDSVKTFNLDPNLIKTWLQSVIDTTLKTNKGLYVKSDASSKKVFGFRAKTASTIYQPELKVVINKSGVYTDTLTYFPEGDVSVVDGPLPTIGATDIAVQSGLVINSKVWFDVSSIPSDAIINKAKLILKTDTLLTIKGTNIVDAILVSNIVDSTNKIIDSTISQENLFPSGNGYEGLVTTFVQNWIGNGKNEGLLLSPSVGINGVDLFVFKGSGTTVFADRPKLEIIYTTRK
ncbi:MAG: hypothetical protein COW08_01830 [Ignavibacteriales bacterium CG12_big_fil_rev_8_21_14_0_65_30_8]|nr:MAG: hypothetical protein COW08_01830 [Ignavibacteriales bacterium CG12_big_fil_rev_8_21_14_0_65_30_8]